jgi:hypothetical protein
MSFRKCRPMVASSDPNLIFDQKCGCCVHGKYLNKHMIRCLHNGEVMTEMPWHCPNWQGRTREDMKQ